MRWIRIRRNPLLSIHRTSEFSQLAREPRPASCDKIDRPRHDPPVIPAISPTILRLFSSYSKWYVHRNFHSARLSVSSATAAIGHIPIVIYLNHASWWDPLIGLLLARELWPDRRHFSPIDAAALERYPILARIGFFGVEANTPRGAAMFLKTSLNILQSPSAALWITGEGAFRDPRTRPTEVRPGLAHLARRIAPAVMLPLAIEYPFWEERFPEVLCRFGTPLDTSGAALSTAQWRARLAEQMQINQDTLAAEAIARKAESFRTILRGRVGVGAIYDSWRWAMAKLRGEHFQRQHGEGSP